MSLLLTWEKEANDSLTYLFVYVRAWYKIMGIVM